MNMFVRNGLPQTYKTVWSKLGSNALKMYFWIQNCILRHLCISFTNRNTTGGHSFTKPKIYQKRKEKKRMELKERNLQTIINHYLILNLLKVWERKLGIATSKADLRFSLQSLTLYLIFACWYMAPPDKNMKVREIRFFLKKRNYSLVLKNFEICDKVTDSQTVASSFGGVGRTDPLLCGSQTGKQI